MRLIVLSIMLALIAYVASAHELTPTYPELKPSYIDGVSVVNVTLFNRREDVQYYDIEVFDKDFNRIPFAASERLVKVNYLERKPLEVYIRDKDVPKATYICTHSKIVKNQTTSSFIASRICSKIK